MPRALFTVALPVRNGGEHLRACVGSILAQNGGDFELDILDNASTDGTTEWLATLRDPRVRLHPADRPLSITENWARIKTLPKNEFLTTIGHDDLLDPDFLQIIAGLIRTHPDAGLYLTHFRLIDGEGKFLRPCRPMPGRETAAEFLAARLCDLRDSFGTGYVLRSATYDAVGGIPAFPKLLYADDALWLRATMRAGPRVTSSQEGFSYRYHAASAARTTLTADYLGAVEQYWDELEACARQEGEIALVLARYGPAYVSLFGRGCWQGILEGRVLRGELSDPALDDRLGWFLARAGLTFDDLRRDAVGGDLARVERAARSRGRRLVYRLLARARAARGRWRARRQTGSN